MDKPMDIMTTEAVGSADAEAEDSLIDDEFLIEEISIDGMCGVY